MRILAPKQKILFWYVGTHKVYLSTPAHSVCGGRCPGGQGGTRWKSLPESGIPKVPPRYHQFTRGVCISIPPFWVGLGLVVGGAWFYIGIHPFWVGHQFPLFGCGLAGLTKGLKIPYKISPLAPVSKVPQCTKYETRSASDVSYQATLHDIYMLCSNWPRNQVSLCHLKPNRHVSTITWCAHILCIIFPNTGAAPCTKSIWSGSLPTATAGPSLPIWRRA
jgi:hypothetical protein